MSHTLFLVVGLIVLVTLVLMGALARLFRKAGPNEALIVYGMRGQRVVKGHGTFLFPMVEHARLLALELMSFDVAPQQDLYTRQGVAVTVEAVAQIKVRSDAESIMTSAEQFLSKSPADRDALIRLVMEGHLRGIIGQLTVEQIVKEPEMVGERMRATCSDDLSKMGLEVVSFTIKEVRDRNEYITNMGRPDIVRIRRDAEIASAEAERDTAIRRAIALREAAVAKAGADQERVLAETMSLAKQAEAQRDLDIQRATFEEQSRRQQAQADKAYELQTNVMQQRVIAEHVKVQQIEKEAQVKVQEAEIQRNEKELIATVLKRSEIDRQRVEKCCRCRTFAPHRGSRRSGAGHTRTGRSRSRGDLSEGRRGGARHEREGRGLPGVVAGGGRGQAADQHGRRGARDGRAPGQCGQDHHCVDGRHEEHRSQQGHRGSDGNRRAGAGVV